jgi:hypothetical protein
MYSVMAHSYLDYKPLRPFIHTPLLYLLPGVVKDKARLEGTVQHYGHNSGCIVTKEGNRILFDEAAKMAKSMWIMLEKAGFSDSYCGCGTLRFLAFEVLVPRGMEVQVFFAAERPG